MNKTRFALSVGLFLTLMAQSRILPDKSIDIESIIPPAPTLGSAVEKQDVAEMTRIVGGRTKADCDKANFDANLNPVHLYGADSKLLTDNEVNAAMPLLKDVGDEVSFYTKQIKDHWKRLRPYQQYPVQFKNCIAGYANSSYPSGHSSVAESWALTLAEIYPAKSTALLRRADEVGYSREVGAVHFPSDVLEGRELAKKLFNKMLQNADFKKRLDTTKERALSSTK